MTSHAIALPDFCPNCAHAVSGPYCAQCGQKVIIETPTLFEFVHEYLHHYVAIDGTLTRTLWSLITRPGKLTTEYIIGRRHSYIKPLQLYLTISFIFFILFGYFGPSITEAVKADPPANAKAEVHAPGTKKDAKLNDIDLVKGLQQELAGHQNSVIRTSAEKGTFLYRWAEQAQKRLNSFETDPTAAFKNLRRDVLEHAPYGIFVLMPIFASLLGLMFWRRHVRYGAHLVFALHFHAFAFLALIVTLVPVALSLSDWISIVLLVYLVMAMRRVYQGGWFSVTLRALLLVFIYSIFVMIVSLMILAQAFGA
jgi:uncharacterized membrane protein